MHAQFLDRFGCALINLIAVPYTKHVTDEQSEAIINTPRAAYLATQTQKDRDAL